MVLALSVAARLAWTYLVPNGANFVDLHVYLGGAAALLRDMLNPEEIVVGGQAFTDYPDGMRQVRAAFAERSLLPPRDIRLTGFGSRVQEAGAGVVSLSSLYADPLGALRRAQSRRPELSA